MIQTYTPLPATRTTRSPQTIAAEIRASHPHTAGWAHVRHYVEAMEFLLTWDDEVPGLEETQHATTFPRTIAHMHGRDVALGFLMNAGAWRGTDARRLKDEIRAALRGEVYHG